MLQYLGNTSMRGRTRRSATAVNPCHVDKGRVSNALLHAYTYCSFPTGCRTSMHPGRLSVGPLSKAYTSLRADHLGLTREFLARTGDLARLL